ncbi:G-protein coupled receptor GRL101-like [Amphiura filiformis]|uniref:G-protein coupled receptor GRL101-like n=1 Tax=Amphiura filiformis TaxID=82378 RepID=UPI003B213782
MLRIHSLPTLNYPFGPYGKCTDHNEQIECKNRACAEEKFRCFYELDRYGVLQGCRDATHLQNCANVECNNETVKCPESYCIQLQHRCNGQMECPNGEDEQGCEMYTCPGRYRCRGYQFCLNQNQVCDGVEQCPYGDDEQFCDLNCPDGCSCTGLSYICDSVIWTPETTSLFPLSIRQLNIRETEIIGAQGSVLRDLDQLQTLHSDKYVFCCLVNDMETISQCLPEPDQFSSCQDLMRNQILRVFMWILGLSAFLGNCFVILWRILPVRRDSKDRRNSVQDILVLNLAIADGLMGVYMLIIASVDMYYRNVYIVYAEEWMSSVLCQLAGSLSVISSEASVCFLTMLSLDRFLGIAFPFSDKKLRRNSAIFTAVSIWCFVSLISFMPFFVKSYFGNHFYGRSSVCLALPLTNDRPPGWFYSIFWFLGFNLICFIAILLCYIGIYIAAKLSASNVGKGSSALTKRQTEQIKMAMKMLFLVGTDFICWMPVIVLGILSTCNIIIISPIVYVCTAVFILPINSSLNPYLYTILTGEIKLKRKRSASNKWKQSGKSTSLVMSNCDSATNHLTTNGTFVESGINPIIRMRNNSYNANVE